MRKKMKPKFFILYLKFYVLLLLHSSNTSNAINTTEYAMLIPDEKNMEPCGNLCFNVCKIWFEMN